MGQRDGCGPRRFKIRHVFLGLLLILLVWFAWFRASAYRDVSGRMRELRDEGYPLSLEELDQSYALPAGAENAADYYMTAFAHYVEGNDEAWEGVPYVSKGNRPARTDRLDAATRQQAERYLAANTETLSLLHQAIFSEHCRYPADLANESDPGEEWLPFVRKTAFLLCLEVLVACERNDPNQAMQTVRANLALARSLSAPTLIHRLVRISVESLAYGTVERVLTRMPLSNEQFVTLSHWLEAPDDERVRQQAFVGERCFGLDVFRGTNNQIAGPGGAEDTLLRLLIVPRKILGLHDRDMLGYIDRLQDCIEAAAFYAEAEAAEGGLTHLIPRDDHRGGLLTRLIAPAFTRIFELEIRKVARQRAMQTALAIERYRLVEGRLPRVLSELVPRYLATVPKDPFDGQDLRYDLLGKGYVVYSVGEDLRDDGGAEKGDRKRDAQNEPVLDVTFIVER